MQPRTVALIAVLSVATGWLASTVVSPDPQATATAADARGPRPLGGQALVAPFTQQLKLKLDEHPRAPSPGRNPFTFGARRSIASPRRPRITDDGASATPVVPAIAVEPSQPRLRLTGIAANRRDGVDVFTAILNDAGSLVFVKAGDKLSNGDTVVRVEETAVVIADAAGVERTLRLK